MMKTFPFIAVVALVGTYMSDIRDCFLPLQHVLNVLIKDYNAFLFTIESSTIAIIFDNKGHYRIFDSHSRDMYGNLTVNGRAIMLELNSIEEIVQYLQNFYSEKSVFSFELLGIKVSNLSGNQNLRYIIRAHLLTTLQKCK